jgi:hypothetical protein
MRFKKQKRIFIFGVGFLLSLFFIFPQFAFAGQVVPTDVLNKINRERITHQLSPLVSNDLLQRAAEEKLSDMIRHKYFAHQSVDGRMPWDFIDEAGYVFSYAGENLAIDYQSADDAVRAWLASTTHRENILNKNFQETGIAVATSDHVYIVQMFGAQLNQPTTSLQVSDINTPSSTLKKNLITEDQTENHALQEIQPQPQLTTIIPDYLTQEKQCPSLAQLLDYALQFPKNQENVYPCLTQQAQIQSTVQPRENYTETIVSLKYYRLLALTLFPHNNKL